MSFKLRSTLVGHEADVRCVVSSLDGGLFSASRDRSCRLWRPDGRVFREDHIFLGHTGYISSVCTLPPTDQYPQGLVVTGGNDNLILVFDFNSLEPVQRLEGHTDTVCALKPGKFGMLISASWDKTAKVWINGKVGMTLSGHEAAVWCVDLNSQSGLILTGSADKTLRAWKAGKCVHTFTGHTDCVRGVVTVDDQHFLSASNDMTVRQWSISGEAMAVFQGHTNYIYSIAIVSGNDFVTSGEDRTVRVWKDGVCAQTINLPCQSVWGVAVTTDGDIAAACSDGMVRVFTSNPELYSPDDEIQVFEEQVANQAIPASDSLDLGEIKVDQLPGPEVLQQPGTKNEQTKLIKRNGVVEAHQWDGSEKKWKKTGEVMGAAAADGSKRTKVAYEGKEYDYVFNVDIEEGKILKLPYNITEDPWQAAHDFLARNQISQTHVEQVVEFIRTNSQGVQAEAVNPNYVDPFTGGHAYVPGGSNPQQRPPTTTGTGDPFTGNQAYMSGGPSQTATSSVKYIPEKEYLKFSTGKAPPIISKLSEFNTLVAPELQVNVKDLQVLSDCLTSLLAGAPSVQNHQAVENMLNKMTRWPADKLLPVLDSLRVLVLDKRLSLALSSEDSMCKLCELSRQTPPSNGMLCYRVFVNTFQHSSNNLTSHTSKLLENCNELYQRKHKNTSIAVSTFLVNCCVFCCKNNTPFEERIQLLTILQQVLSVEIDGEAMFRLLVAIGTILHGSEDSVSFVKSTELRLSIEPLKSHAVQKVKDCAVSISSMLV